LKSIKGDEELEEVLVDGRYGCGADGCALLSNGDEGDTEEDEAGSCESICEAMAMKATPLSSTNMEQ
jgi:hypothetical protein